MTESFREGLLKKFKPMRLLADSSRKKLAKKVTKKIGLSDLNALAQI